MIRCLVLLLIVLLAASLLIGDGIIAWPDWLIFTQIRLPRTILAALVGFGGMMFSVIRSLNRENKDE